MLNGNVCLFDFQAQSELQESRSAVQRLESQLEHGSKSSERNQRDFELAIKARDEATQNAQQLLEQLQDLEERHKTAVRPHSALKIVQCLQNSELNIFTAERCKAKQ